ncbi:universal stress protein [Salirhabdus sp. Marseille-P4669]|uniref:universal stress protein n=1 Tax=Salirhabdus sp. Marseille-P4669 TaxID=2042310 RepID=UPI000C7CD9A2|nr:universal stress protein [Salirhabdus sp. Marseille-P4669]
MPHNYKDILVAVDGSDASSAAFFKAVEIAKANNATLVITHVIDTTVYTHSVLQVNYNEELEVYAKELLHSFQKQAQSMGIHDVVVHLAYGSPKMKISKDIAKKYHIDLIICGATGHNRVERFLIGSVSEHITRHADVDVLVVRANK